MAIMGKKKYLVYLDVEDAEYVKACLAGVAYTGGFSALVNEYVKSMAKTLRASKIKPGQRLNAANVMKLVWNGLREVPGEQK